MRHAVIIDTGLNAGHLVLFDQKKSQTELFEQCVWAWEKGIFPDSIFENGLDTGDLIMARTKSTENKSDIEKGGDALIKLIQAEVDAAEVDASLGELKEPILKVINAQKLSTEEIHALNEHPNWKKAITNAIEQHSRLSLLREEFEPYRESIIGILDLIGDSPTYTPLARQTQQSPKTTAKSKNEELDDEDDDRELVA